VVMLKFEFRLSALHIPIDLPISTGISLSVGTPLAGEAESILSQARLARDDAVRTH
jgi:hypothetical protein